MTDIPRRKVSKLQRFMRHFKINLETGCWEWTANTVYGYGLLMVEGIPIRAHRLSHEIFKGAIPDGLHIDHLCCNRACVNPEHIEAVTQAENNKRRGERYTHCKHGHPYTPENTYSPKRGGKQCRICRNVVMVKYWAKRAEQSLIN